MVVNLVVKESIVRLFCGHGSWTIWKSRQFFALNCAIRSNKVSKIEFKKKMAEKNFHLKNISFARAFRTDSLFNFHDKISQKSASYFREEIQQL